MAPSTTRKEEAELRQVAKKARLARKEAKTRAHKQRLRAARSATTTAAGEDNKEANSITNITNAAQPKRKRQGAIILPDEIADLRRRLFDTTEKKGDEEESTTTTKKARGAKKAKKQAKGKDKAVVVNTKEAASTSTQASAQPAPEEPNYHPEIHFKRKMVLVDVILHHVPHQKIDLSGCTADKLVVDTTQHTKKYRLELPMPSGLRVNVAQSEFELENGVLHCRLPIANDDIPSELQAQWSALAEKMRAQKALRFHMKQDGQLTVRVRQALLPQESKVVKAAKSTKAEVVDNDEEHDEAEVEKVNAEKKKKAATATTTAKDTKRPRDATAEQASKSAKPPTTTTSNSKTSAPSKVDVFEQERIRALSVAKEAAKKARLTLKQRVELAKQVQQRRQARLEIRTERKTQKDARKQSTFARVLEEQKRQLLERAAHQAAIEAAEKKRAEAKKAGTASTKSVHFAQD